MNNNSYFVYILSNKSNNILYIGVTSDILRRIYEHKNKLVEGFSSKYNINKLLYYEMFNEINYAIEREKQLKKWSRAKKYALIETMNHEYTDLYLSLV